MWANLSLGGGILWLLLGCFLWPKHRSVFGLIHYVNMKIVYCLKLPWTYFLGSLDLSDPATDILEAETRSFEDRWKGNQKKPTPLIDFVMILGLDFAIAMTLICYGIMNLNTI